jgi:hypothetical protein
MPRIVAGFSLPSIARCAVKEYASNDVASVTDDVSDVADSRTHGYCMG